MTTVETTNGVDAALGLPRPIVELIPVSLIDASPTNPRKTFDQADLDDLAKSLAAIGQLENILVRPSPSKPKRFELVFGERRWRAAKIAKLPELLAAVKELTDVQVLETQLIENAKRKDLHPLEEAETYEALHKKHHYSVDDIALKVNKSRATVYASLKLCALSPACRKLFLDGKLTTSTALYVARIPGHDLQDEAAKEITRDNYDGPMSARRAADFVQSKYMLRLADAPFDKGDAELVPKAGSCLACPKRTGNQKELFADVKSADTCTDPKCFEAKKDAGWKKRAEAAEAKGQTVLSDKQAKKVFEYGGVSRESGFIDLQQTNYRDPKARTFKQLLGKDAPPVVLARDDLGKVHELVDEKAATAAVKKAGHKWAKPEPKAKRPKNSPPGLEELEDQLLGERLFEAAAKKELSESAVLRLVVKYFTADTYAYDQVATRRGLVSKPKSKGVGAQMNSLDAADRALNTVAGKAKAPDLRKLVVELLVAHAVENSGMAEDTKLFPQILAALKVDRKAIAAEAKKAAKPKAKKKGAKK